MATLLRRLHARDRSVAGDETDADLVALAREDRRSFAPLYDRYFDAIYRYCYARLGNRDRAEDATQQVFMQAMEGVDRYQEAGRFRSWLFTIAHNIVATELIVRPRTEPAAPVEGAIDPSTGPEADAIAAVERLKLLAAISHLPSDQRRAIELRLAGLTGREIARELDRSHEAVKMLQQRALVRLRIELSPTKCTEACHDA